MSGGSMDYLFRRLFDVLDTRGWEQFAEEHPLAAEQVKMEIERLAGKLKAIEWDTSGDGSWPEGATEGEIIDYLSTARYADPWATTP